MSPNIGARIFRANKGKRVVVRIVIMTYSNQTFRSGLTVENAGGMVFRLIAMSSFEFNCNVSEFTPSLPNSHLQELRQRLFGVAQMFNRKLLLAYQR
jgi:hypothetical protein